MEFAERRNAAISFRFRKVVSFPDAIRHPRYIHSVSFASYSLALSKEIRHAKAMAMTLILATL